eukprot:GHUV01015731.1.p1 GENE.GHUV01015731.1~~GHUV01015731.1.p1  ORF type:complete len:334 (+),score=42.71 GHUV01015731.1:987-1988(+)
MIYCMHCNISRQPMLQGMVAAATPLAVFYPPQRPPKAHSLTLYSFILSKDHYYNLDGPLYFAALHALYCLQAANAAGYGGSSHKDVLTSTKSPKGTVDYFVELHIEQGPLLEQEEKDIGVVTAIAAPAALEVKFSGDGGHAGAQLMPLRNDAGLAAAELALAVEAHTLATGADDTVGTTGIFEISPNAVNSVPREARLAIDVRDIDGERRDAVVQAILYSAAQIAMKRKVRVNISMINQDPPAVCDDRIQSAVTSAAAELGLSTNRMVSRAYHDSLFMARIAPTGMIFIPCKNGWSHRPDEFASEKDIGNGVGVLALTMAQLSDGVWQDKDEL